jgi:hypothetical protein
MPILKYFNNLNKNKNSISEAKNRENTDQILKISSNNKVKVIFQYCAKMSEQEQENVTVNLQVFSFQKFFFSLLVAMWKIFKFQNSATNNIKKNKYILFSFIHPHILLSFEFILITIR